MAARKNAIVLSEDLVDLLKNLYLEFGFPSDQYKRRPAERARFVKKWNDLAERNDSGDDLLHFIVNRRKDTRPEKKWVTFGGRHKRLESMPEDFLSPKEWKQLADAYKEVLVSRQMGSDNLVYDKTLREALGKAFAVRSGRIVHPTLLAAAIEAKRKRGEWLHLPPQPRRDAGFSDFDQAANE